MDRKQTNQEIPRLVQKRIAFVCFSRSLGGLELTTLHLANAVGSREYFALTIVPPSSPLQQRATALGLKVDANEPRWKYGDVAAALRLGLSLRRNKIDIVVLTQSKDIHLAALASLISRNLKLVFYQQMDSGYNKRDLLHSWVYSKLSQWITLTSGMRSNVLTFTRMNAKRVNVIPLGIDLKRFDPSRYQRSEARTFFKLPQKKRIIGVLGRLDPQKGQEIVLRAMPALVKKHPDIHMVVAGDETAGEPGSRNRLEEICKMLHIEDRVTFLPFTNDVPRLIASLDIFVLPSFSETFGLVLIEAMAMKRAVIATNAGGVPEIITDGETGLLVPPRDSEAISKAIHALLTNTRLRTNIIRSARAKALANFDFSLTVDSFLETVTPL